MSAFSDEFEKLTISLSLNDIADITVIDTSALVFSKLDGAHSITISVTKQAGYSGATLSDDLNALLESLTGEEEFSDLQYAVLYDDGHYTNELIDTVIENLLWGALLAVVILFIFLKDLRPTLLTALSMVISVVATFVIMYFAGISLNLMSMAGLAMGIGMLVDNSVVVIENIYRLRARGAPVKEAVVTGTSQMSGAILASTITSLIVWLPILFTQGLTKTVVKDMAITLCLSLAVSLVVAVTFVPSLAQYTVKNYRPREDKAMSAVKKAYSRSLSFTLRHKWITLVVVGVMLALAVTSFFFMDSRFFPETDTGSLTVNVSIDAVAVNSAKDEKGEKLSYEEVREEVCDKLFDYLSAMPESEHVNMTISSNVNIAGYNIEAEGLDVGADTISAMVKLKEGKRESAKQLCDKLTKEDQERYEALIHVDKGLFDMEDELLAASLKTLSRLLAQHYGRKVVILIDEYDVPLDKAFQAGYYDEMVSLIRNMFGNALKTNENLQFAVLTGCLRISKESIFTGLNNLNVMTISDPYFSDSFGFTDAEVAELLRYYGLEGYHDMFRSWYDGYRFGGTSVYCPWDVIKYAQILLRDPEAEPENYWANTSGNGIIRRLLKKADQTTRDEVEQLINGECIVKTVRQELTYRDIESTAGAAQPGGAGAVHRPGEGLVPGGDAGGYFPHQPLLRGLPQRGRSRHPGYAARLPVGFHQRAGHGGAQQHEGELLPRDAAGPAAKPGELDRPLQRGGGRRLATAIFPSPRRSGWASSLS